MGVTLQLILGLLLVLVTCSFAETPPTPQPIQNVTEINNRDLNKILKTDTKTETLDPKDKSLINHINNFDQFPIKLGKVDDETQNKIDNETKQDNESETQQKNEKPQETSRALDSSKYWSSEFHSKLNALTLSSLLHITTTESVFDGTRHPSFESNAELTTPITTIFDNKFKETVESVDQKLDNVDLENDEQDSDDDEQDDSSNGEELTVEDLLKKRPENATIDYEKTQAIVNNETIEKNSIHKDLNVEQTKKLNFENVFNETKVYDESEEGVKGENEERAEDDQVVTTPAEISTRKSSILKESDEGTTLDLLNNKIETEFATPAKGSTTTIMPTTSVKAKGDVENVLPVSTTASPEKSTSSSTTTTPATTTTTTPATTTTTTPSTTTTPVTTTTPAATTLTATTTLPATIIVRSNISDQENIIPLRLGTRKPFLDSTFDDVSSTTAHSKPTEATTKEPALVTTAIIGSTITLEATTLINHVMSDATMSSELQETTTGVDEKVTTVTDGAAEETTVDISRASKSIVTEEVSRTSEKIIEEPTTKEVEISTDSTVKNEVDSTTFDVNNTQGVESSTSKLNYIEKVEDADNSTTMEPTSTEVEEQTTQMSLQTVILNESNVENSSDVITEQNFISKDDESTVKETKILSTTELYTTAEEMKTTSSTTVLSVEREASISENETLPTETPMPQLNVSRKGPDTRGSNMANLTEEIMTSSVTTVEVNDLTVPIITTTENNTDISPSDSFTKESDGDNKGKIAAIAISGVGAVCLVILAGLLYVMKKRQKRLNYGPRCRPVSLDDYSIDNLSVYNSVRRKGGAARMSKRSFGNPAFEDPVAPSHPLNFAALVKFAANYEDIKAEFEDVPQITAKTSELPEGCDTKNRYANVIPLPETRVYLNFIDGYPNSDYINANYVTGPKNTKGYYIATQGPMHNTVDDFWRMVWEQQSKVILMLTHLVENGLEKCADYLPESEVLECSRIFGDFQITLKKREVKEKYIISSLQLKNMVSNSWREVTHFWYLGWPEKGVPNEVNSIIAFLIEARSYMKSSTIDKKDGLNGIQNGNAHSEHSPVVVHCSPGTGRTGVAIACDIAIREFETTRLVDIPKIVYRIRRDRANAVQTKEQYIFIYKVVSLYATKLTGGALENL